LSYSFEDFYQALRRSYRFGQEREVNAYIVQARTEGAILSVVKHKIEQHARMQEQMKVAALALRKKEKTIMMKTDIEKASGDGWELYHGDCVRVAAEIENDSVGISVFSPPFADLFTYSADVQDMGNCDNKDEFAKQFKFLITEIYRVLKPGRMACVHCNDLLSTKWKHGKIEFQDFSGDIVRAFRETGFAFHSRVTIWKDPVTEMQRTKAHGLLYKTLLNDSTSSRMGSPEYLLIFKKPGENAEPVTHTKESFNLDQWQEWASPVWTTIDQGNVLNKELSRDESDERHICPLQLDVIERALVMWSNPGDLVYSPFTGIGSEGYQALRMDRRFVGSELKESYFRQACRFLQSAKSQLNLFAA
jgi:DNA modification methylase